MAPTSLTGIIESVQRDVDYAHSMIEMNEGFIKQREVMNIQHRASIRENQRLLDSLKTLVKD